MRVGSLEIEIMASMAKLSRDMNDAQRIVGGSMANVERSVASAKRAMQALGVGLPLAMITDQVRRMTDQYTKLDAQLRLSTKSQAQYAQGMSDIRRISTVAQADLSATSMLYTRLMNVMQGTGVEQSKLATVTETVSFGLKAYGATAQEASSAALQLSQAMGANRLGGEEFRAVMEAMPNVMKVLADSMGVPLGALRQLSIDGKITADEMVKAFGNPAIAAEFKRLAENAQTITGAWVVARNELTLLVGEFMKSSGSTNVFINAFKALGETFALLAKHMGSLVLIASTYVAFLVTKLVVGTALAIEKSIAHTEALAMNAAANLRAAQAEASLVAAKAATASATAASTVSLLRNTLATVEANTATLAKTVSDNAATVAQLNHARASGMMSGQLYIVRQVEAELVVTTQALAVAQTELNASTARQTRLQAALIAEDKAALKARADLVKANAAVVVSQNAVTASAVGNIAAIGVALRTATMAHPIAAAALAISAIVVAIANWKDIVDGGKASFSWFMDDFLGGIQFLAMGVGISLGELVQKIGLLATVTVPQLKSGEFKKQWDELGKIAEQSRVDAAAKIAGIDKDETKRENFEQALRQMQDRDAWDKLHATKQQQRAAEIAELNTQYAKLAGLQGRSQAEQMALAEDYRVKMALINEKYSRADVKAAAKADKELNAMREASAKYQQDSIDDINAETDALLKKIEQERFDTEAIGKTKEQLALLQSVRYDNITALQEQKVAALEASYGDAAEIAAIKEQIKARKELKGVWSTQAVAQAADAQSKAWADVWDSVDKTAHDTFVSIMNGGKDTATRLKEAFKNGFFDWLYSMTLKKWIVNISGTMAGGASATAMAGTGGGAGMGDWMSVGNMIKDGFTGLSSSFTTLAGSISGGLQSMGVSAGTAGSLGVAGAYAGAGLAGIQLGMMIGGDKKALGMDATTTSAIGAAIGAAIGGPIGALIGGAAGGVFSAAFGRGPKQSGTTTLAGQFSGAGFAGQQQTPWSQSGGWFSSGRSGMDVSPLGAAQQASLNALVQGTQSVFNNLIAVSGDAAKSLDGWTFAIDRQVATEAQAQQLTIDMAEAMGQHLVPTLAAFMQQGENLADTAVRMRDEFVVTNGILGLVGGSFGAVGLASMGARDNLVQLMGGIQGVNTSMQSYYQNFFTDTERHANDLRALTVQFTQLGLTVPDTATGFRLLVSSQDLSTESGRQLFAVLMSLQGAFSALIPSAEQAAQAVAQAVAANIKALQDKSIADFDAARKATDSLRAFVLSVRDLQRSLWAGQQTPLSSTYSVTRSQFSATNALAGAGNANAQGALSGAATAFLDAAKLQAVSAVEYARDFAFVQNALNDTALLTEDAVTVADQQLDEMKKSNAWLAALDSKSASQTQSLQYLLSAAVASSEAARLTIVEKSIAGLTAEIAAAVGSGYNQANLSRSVGAAGETALSYAGAYKTVGGSVNAAGVSSGMGTSVSASQQAAIETKNRVEMLNAQRLSAQAEIDRAKSIVAPATYINGQTSDPAWELILGRFNAWHQSIDGIPMNRPWNADVDAARAYSSLVEQYRAAAIAKAQGVYDSIPQFAVGTNEVPYDMTARIHRGEEIKPKVYVEADKVAREETNKLLRDMKKELTLIKSHNYRMLLIQDKHDNEGMPEVRVA